MVCNKAFQLWPSLTQTTNTFTFSQVVDSLVKSSMDDKFISDQSKKSDSVLLVLIVKVLDAHQYFRCLI